MEHNGVSIIEYLQGSHPWINSSKYTLFQVLLFFLGALSWLVCYADAIYDIVKKKTVSIPVLAVCLNFGWEIATCLFFVPDMGKLLVLSYWGWMIFDAFIFVSAVRYGYKQMQVKFFIDNSRILTITAIVVSFLSQATFITQYDLPMAPISGYIINLPMSIGFIYLLFVPGFDGYSKLAAWSKFIGTGLISIMFFTKYPENNFLTVMYIAVAVFDILYIILLYRKHKREI